MDVPCGADLTTDDDAFNNLTADKIEIQSDSLFFLVFSSKFVRIIGFCNDTI